VSGHIESCAVDDAAQDCGDDDHVVGVAKYKDEVGDHIDVRRQVSQ